MRKNPKKLRKNTKKCKKKMQKNIYMRKNSKFCVVDCTPKSFDFPLRLSDHLNFLSN